MDPGPPRLPGVRVLLVEDDADTRDVFCQMLEESGAFVKCVGSAADALSAVELFQPDVIVADLGLPALDGFDLIRNIRALPKSGGGRTAALAFTGHGGLSKTALAAGFDAFLPKPASGAELISAVAAIVPRP